MRNDDHADDAKVLGPVEQFFEGRRVMSSGKGLRPIKILFWLAAIGLGVAAGIALVEMLLAGGADPRSLAWEDVVTTFVGVCFLCFIPVSMLRWAVIPEARIEGTLAYSLISMGAAGVALSLPVLSRGWIDSGVAFVVVLVLFAAQAVISVVMHRKADELMRRSTTDSTVISAALLIGGFSIYAAGERLGVIGAISPWGLVGIACIIQFAVSMYVYYRLGMNPEAQEEAPAKS
jgi:hypothetical protein